MKQWAIKTPKGKDDFVKHSIRPDEETAWHMAICDGKNVGLDKIYHGSEISREPDGLEASIIRVAKSKGYKCVRVNVMEVSE